MHKSTMGVPNRQQPLLQLLQQHKVQRSSAVNATAQMIKF